MAGYFQAAHNLCKDPVDGTTDYVFFGFAVVMAPIGVPLYYLGKWTTALLDLESEDERDD